MKPTFSPQSGILLTLGGHAHDHPSLRHAHGLQDRRGAAPPGRGRRRGHGPSPPPPALHLRPLPRPVVATSVVHLEITTESPILPRMLDLVLSAVRRARSWLLAVTRPSSSTTAAATILHTRRVLHASVTRSPSDQWTAQQLRNVLLDHDAPRFLIRDNHSKFGASFLSREHTPAPAPQALGNTPQAGIPGLVAVSVVEGLEVVDVDHHQGDS